MYERRKERDTVRLAQSVLDNIAEVGPLPFELRVLEALLDETARQFERRHQRLELLSQSIEEDISKTLRRTDADLQRLLPIQRCVAHPPMPPLLAGVARCTGPAQVCIDPVLQGPCYLVSNSL
jgi:antitoxin component of RelBE/YafQ-DinJ toxin-antitoxin module